MDPNCIYIDPYTRLSTYAAGRTIGYTEARDLAIAIAQEKGPEYFDEIGGAYFHLGKPSCLVGAMLDKMGVTYQQMAMAGANATGIDGIASLGIIVPEDAKTAQFLRALQMANDQGATWMHAVSRALDLVGDDPDLAYKKFEEPTEVRIVKETISWVELIEENAQKKAVTIAKWEQATQDLAHRSDHVLVA